MDARRATKRSWLLCWLLAALLLLLDNHRLAAVPCARWLPLCLSPIPLLLVDQSKWSIVVGLTYPPVVTMEAQQEQQHQQEEVPAGLPVSAKDAVRTDEDAIYDRQIRLWGAEAQVCMMQRARFPLFELFDVASSRIQEIYYTLSPSILSFFHHLQLVLRRPK